MVAWEDMIVVMEVGAVDEEVSSEVIVRYFSILLISFSDGVVGFGGYYFTSAFDLCF